MTDSDRVHSHPSMPAQPGGDIEAFVRHVMAAPEHAHHGMSAGMAADHARLLALVPRGEASHVAVRNGDWFDPATWYQGRIPDAGAKVLIPENVTVHYNDISDSSLFTLRIDGALTFATDADTRMVVDTLVVSPSGRLEIGTAENPVQAGVAAEIKIANKGDIDIGWDPALLSRGIISHGAAEIHGAEKTAFLKLAEHAMAGDTVLKLAEVPTGWQVGDRLVLTGTHKEGWSWDNAQRDVLHRESQDEEVTITAINGDRLVLDRPLTFDHDTPRDDLSAYVANMTRNITISSIDGAATETHHRGHVMFMHSDEVDVRYAAFDDLGRTDKSMVSQEASRANELTSDFNAKARYPFHLHKTGVEAGDNPAIAIGNTVSGSPGWGFVHHGSNADFISNVAFDVFGAGFVAEDGNETGVWGKNMAIRSVGIGYGDWTVKHFGDPQDNDIARTGDGFFFAGRQVAAYENIAVNTTHGFTWFHRAAPEQPLTENLQYPGIGYGQKTVLVNNTPIEGFRDNEAFGTQIGLIVVKSSPQQNNDLRSVLDGFLNWETSQGVMISYTSHYTMLDFDLLATKNKMPIAWADIGAALGTNTLDMVFNGLKIDGFSTGFKFFHGSSGYTSHYNGIKPSDIAHFLIDLEMTNVLKTYENYNPQSHTIISSTMLEPGRLSMVYTGPEVYTFGQPFSRAGTVTDSIGTKNRLSIADEKIVDQWAMMDLVKSQGYWTLEDGTRVIKFQDYISDRATGKVLELEHVVKFAVTDAQIERFGLRDNSLAAPEPEPEEPQQPEPTPEEPQQPEPTPEPEEPQQPEPAEEEPQQPEPEPEEPQQPEPEAPQQPGPENPDDPPPTDPIHNRLVSSVSVDLGAKPETQHIRNLVLLGSDNLHAVGNDLDNKITGNGGNNLLIGGAGNDTLNGVSGANVLMGGAGDDVYIVNSIHDVVDEATERGGRVDAGGHDRVESSVTFNLNTHIGVQFVEDLLLTGTDNINGFGNDLDNLLIGNAGNNTLWGGMGHDTLMGGDGNDVLLGGSGNDLLLGGTGNDTLFGDNGNDTLDGGAGDDQLFGGAGNDVLYGREGNDTLTGGAGNDTLYGGPGSNVLHGGAGADVFVFDAAPDSGTDTIRDFQVGIDSIWLAQEVFTAIAPGTALTGFRANTTGQAEAAGDRIIYDRQTGRLYYDEDGSGATGPVHFANLTRGLDLSADDFLLI